MAREMGTPRRAGHRRLLCRFRRHGPGGGRRKEGALRVPQRAPRLMSESESATLRAICRMCHGGCGTLITVKDGRMTRVEGDPQNPVNLGKLCSKAGVPSVEQSYHPDRVEFPLL